MTDPPTERSSLRTRLVRRRCFVEALERDVDLSIFRTPPSTRLAGGLVLIGASYVMGWPCMVLLSAVAVWLKHPKWALVGPAILYAISWIVWTTGIWLAGPESVAHLRTLKQWGLRWFATRFLIR